MNGRALRCYTNEDGAPVVYWQDLSVGPGDAYFAGTEDEHSFDGEPARYMGPTEVEIRAAWDGLTEKQRFVLGRLRGSNGDGHQYTQQEIADVMGLTQQAVDAIEKRALARLRHLSDALALPVAA